MPSAVHCFGRIIGDDENVEIAHGIFAAAITAGEFKLVDAFALAEVPAKLRDHAVRLGPQKPQACGLGEANAFENGLLRFFAEAFQLLHLQRFASGLEIGQRFDA